VVVEGVGGGEDEFEGVSGPFVELSLGSGGLKLWEVVDAVVVSCDGGGPGIFRLLTTTTSSELPDESWWSSSSVGVLEPGLGTPDLPFSWGISCDEKRPPADGNGNPSPSGGVVPVVMVRVDLGPAPGSEPVPLAWCCSCRPMRGGEREEGTMFGWIREPDESIVKLDNWMVQPHAVARG
jgi:hypothetical protein